MSSISADGEEGPRSTRRRLCPSYFARRRRDALGGSPHDCESPISDVTTSPPPTVPAALVGELFQTQGRLDIIVAAHAHPSEHDLTTATAQKAQPSWAVKVRSILSLVQPLAQHHQAAPPRPSPDGSIAVVHPQTTSTPDGEYLGALSARRSAGELLPTLPVSSPFSSAIKRARSVARFSTPKGIPTIVALRRRPYLVSTVDQRGIPYLLLGISRLHQSLPWSIATAHQ